MKRYFQFQIKFFLLSILAIAFSLSSCGPKDAAKSSGSLANYKRSGYNLYSEKTDVRLGSQVMGLQIQTMRRKGVGVNLAKHRQLKARLDRITRNLAAVSDKPKYPYQVFLFDEPEVANAFAMPGGKFGVFIGLFDRKTGLINPKSDDEIAAVMAHEMAHASLRHVTRRMSGMQSLGIFGAIVSVGIGSTVGANTQLLFEQVFNLSANLYLPSYSRKFERQADQVGLYYMAKAGYNPQAAVDVWKRAAARGGKNAQKTSVFASHPASGVRAKRLEKWLGEANALYRQAARNR